MAKRRRLIVANWKMHGRLTSGLALARDIADKAAAARPLAYEVALCPPATLIWAINEVLIGTNVALGAQDCHTATHGAFTGDISAAMLADLGCRYVIVGHSERRIGHNETNELVADKAEAGQSAGLTTIVCVGETAEQLQTGKPTEVVAEQLKASLPPKNKTSLLVVAYEPVWAIGSGQQPSPADIAAMHKMIRKVLGPAGEAVPVIYGGSVTPGNAAALFAEAEVDGALVGSASLNADGFWAIAEKSV